MPIELDGRFPLYASAPWEQNDAPIRHLHVHSCLELGVCFAGSGIFVVGEKVLPFAAGDVSFIGPREPHLAQSAPGTRSRWTWIYLDPARLVRGDNANALDASPFCGADFPNIWSASEHPALNGAVQRLCHELQAGEEGCEDVCRATVWELMARVRRAFGSVGNGETAGRGGDFERLAPALERLTGRLDAPASGAELARLCNLSEAHFRRLFRANMGRSPYDYALDWRIRMAAAMLQSSSKSILHVAQDAGFVSLSSFNRCFLKTFGVSPRVWRAGNR